MSKYYKVAFSAPKSCFEVFILLHKQGRTLFPQTDKQAATPTEKTQKIATYKDE